MFEKKFDEKVNEKSKFQNFDFSSSKNRNFEILIFHWLFHQKNFEHFLVSKKKIRHFSEKYFSSQEKIFFSGTNFLKSKIWSGIQKSYLENYTSIIKLFKIKNPVFLTQISGFPYDSVRCYVHRPLSGTFHLSE